MTPVSFFHYASLVRKSISREGESLSPGTLFIVEISTWWTLGNFFQCLGSKFCLSDDLIKWLQLCPNSCCWFVAQTKFSEALFFLQLALFLGHLQVLISVLKPWERESLKCHANLFHCRCSCYRMVWHLNVFLVRELQLDSVSVHASYVFRVL